MNWNQQRTNEAPNPVAGNPNIAKVYLTGVYVRLSVEDGGLGKESESLLHQEQFLMRYLEQHPQMQTLAVCFEEQVMEEVPFALHDIRPAIIVTDQKCYE